MDLPTPEQSALKIVTGVLGKKDVSFMEFRNAMTLEHPLLDDMTVHSLWMQARVTAFFASVDEPEGTLDEVFEAARRETAKHMRAKWGQAPPEPLKLRKPEFDMIGPKPIMDTTIGEALESIGRRVKAIWKNLSHHAS